MVGDIVAAYRALRVAGIPVTGVSELVLEVVDLDAAVHFYAEVLGLPLVERWEDREAVWVMAGDADADRPLAARRSGSRAAAAASTSTTRCTSRPRTTTPPSPGCASTAYEPHEERFEGYDGSRAAYVDDPDGNVVELWTWDVANHLARVRLWVTGATGYLGGALVARRAGAGPGGRHRARRGPRRGAVRGARRARFVPTRSSTPRTARTPAGGLEHERRRLGARRPRGGRRGRAPRPPLHGRRLRRPQGRAVRRGRSRRPGHRLRPDEGRGRAARRGRAPGRAARPHVADRRRPRTGEPSKHELAARDRGDTWYTNEIRSPVQVDDLAAALLELLRDLDVAGPLHVAGADAVSRHELAELAAGAPCAAAWRRRRARSTARSTPPARRRCSARGCAASGRSAR